MRTFIVTLLACLSASLLNAQQWIDKKYTYTTQTDLVYGTAVNFNGGVDTLKMDVFLPVCDDNGGQNLRPLLMWIHGGAFLAGDKNDVSIQNLCKEFAKRGYVTASIDYRLGFVSDDVLWQCNYPNYSCVFASDSAEWVRAYYRAVQDAKGALRYLVNRSNTYHIDANNLFVAGESAGAFTALGVALMDTLSEKPSQTLALPDAPLPHVGTWTCGHNVGKSFSGNGITRPDLGGIDGTIEPSTVPFTIKGIGNMYGAMYANLLRDIPANKPRPAIYSFHQPCDIVVPIDSNVVYWGLSWCFTNGYNCMAIANNQMKLYGSRAFSNWNSQNNLGYTIQNEFTAVNFPFSYLFGQGSCTDQVNNPCHAYDNASLRENNLANFFAGLVTTNPACDTTTLSLSSEALNALIRISPNPATDYLNVRTEQVSVSKLQLSNLTGQVCLHIDAKGSKDIRLDLRQIPDGLYYLSATTSQGQVLTTKVLKQKR
jgi:hypothetical protein